MKTAIVMMEGAQQIMFAPENDIDKQALKLLGSDPDISFERKTGSFLGTSGTMTGYEINQCRGGYLRAYENNDCLMLVLTPKKDV